MQTQLLRQAETDEARLAAAEVAREEGDFRRAVVFYSRLAYKTPPTEQSKKAKDAMAELQEAARQRLSEIAYDISSGDVVKGFAALRQLAHDYGKVPDVGREIRSYMRKTRRRADVAAVLNEPNAKRLLTGGQEHEQNGAMCCAYLTYEKARRLSPAPSALKAVARLEQLRGDTDLVESAEHCRRLQECHRTYRIAERLITSQPQRAGELFQEVLKKTPTDAEIYLAARKQLAALGSQ